MHTYTLNNIHAVVKRDFLGYLEEWDRDVEACRKQKQKHRLSRETLEGMRITSNIQANVFMHRY